MSAIETIPNAFWTALNNQNLTDLLPPRWSILVNDTGIQCTLYWESGDTAPPSPPPSPDIFTAKSSMIRVKRHAPQQVSGAVAKRIRPNPCRNTFSADHLTNLIQGRNPLVPINTAYDAAAQTLEKKFSVTNPTLVTGFDQLDPDRSRQNALSNLSQAIQQQINSAQLRNSIEQFQNPGRNIIRVNNVNNSPKSSTPVTDVSGAKSVIQPIIDCSLKDKTTITDNTDDNSPDNEMSAKDYGAQELRNTVVCSGDSAQNDLVSETALARRLTKTVISDSFQTRMETNSTDQSPPATAINEIESSTRTTANGSNQNEQNNISSSIERENRCAEDTDDINLEVVMKTQAQLNAHHNISSIVQNAAEALRSSTASAVLNPAANVSNVSAQPDNQGIQVQMQGQEIQSTAQLPKQITGNQSEPIRTQADILKDNLSNMKEELNDSDCELVEDADAQKNDGLVTRVANNIGHRPLTFEPPTTMLGQRQSIGSITIPSAFNDINRPVVTTSQKVIGNRVGVSGNNRVPITSVDKLAEQNGHKAELQALRQEANRGDEYLSMSRFVRTLSKIIFEPGELMVDSVKDIDKNKIAILLTETQRWYRANMAEVRQTLSIRLSEIRKSKRAAHWQTGRAQVMTQGWPQFPQNGTMPRYMNESRYFSLSNPISLDARPRNLALTDTNFAHISNEMDA